jgi:hypothetical protein
MKKVLFSILMIALLVSVVQAGTPTIPINKGAATSSVSSTYANSEADTITIYREPGLTALSFSAIWADSVKTGATIAGKILRVFNADTMTFIGADTLAFTDKIKVKSGAIGGTITLSSATQPLPDIFIVIITYASSGNAVNVGTTATRPKVVYKVEKSYAYKP